MQLASIADHPDLVETIGRWHWDEWGNADSGGSAESWIAGLRRRVTRDEIPTLYVALGDGGELLGSASLCEHDLPDRRDLAHLTPWLSGVYVTERARGRGVGSALVRHAVERAWLMGIQRLYLYTETAEVFYERLGWKRIGADVHEGEDVVLMAIS